MKKRLIKVVIGFIGLTFWGYGYSQQRYVVRLEKKAVIGEKEPILQRLEGVCEDKEGNFYVIDRNAFKVYKFSPEGKQVLVFGQKGEGPGDFLKPIHISITENDQIMVCEDINIASLFDRQGKFIERHHLNQHMGGMVLTLQYAGPDLFYLEKIIPGNQRQQMLVKLKGMTTKELFTLPDISISIERGGGHANYMVRIHECTPVILFTHFKGYSAAGYSKKYDILLLDNQGKTLTHLKRDIDPQPASASEKKSFARVINETRLPDEVKKGVIEKLPETKNIFDQLLISHRYVFVSRTKPDVTDEDAPRPFDLFSLEGKFLGTLEMKDKPVLVTERYMYIPETDDEDNLLLVKYAYQIR